MTPLSEESASRLMRLADFLGKVPDRAFYYGDIVRGTHLPTKEFDCGTVACAFGYTPLVFPDHFQYRLERNRVELYHNGKCASIFNWSALASGFFGISENEALGLFSPGDQHCIGQPPLSIHATPREVASLIVHFVSERSNNTPAQ